MKLAKVYSDKSTGTSYNVCLKLKVVDYSLYSLAEDRGLLSMDECERIHTSDALGMFCSLM